jgi:hypothetical protein
MRACMRQPSYLISCSQPPPAFVITTLLPLSLMRRSFQGSYLSRMTEYGAIWRRPTTRNAARLGARAALLLPHGNAVSGGE